MRKLIFTILLFALAFTAKAQPIDSLKKANDYYAANEMQKAINLYEKIYAEGYESAVLYFNMGNAYFKNNDLINALLYFERAKLLDPNDEDIQFNIDMVNQFVVDKIEPLPRPFFVKWINSLIRSLPADSWAIWSVVSFVLMLIFALGYLFLQAVSLKKMAFALGIILLIFSGITYIFSSKQHENINNRNHAIIYSPSVTVKGEPNTGSIDLFVIHEGLKVEIVKILNNWFEIKLEDGNRGWVQKETLKVI